MTRRAIGYLVTGLVAALVAGAVAAVFLFPRRVVAPGPRMVYWPSVVTDLAGVGAPGMLEGRGVAAAFSDPFGIAVDAAGNTWVADAGDNNAIWRIDRDGAAIIVAGGCEGFADGQGRAACFNSPSAIAVDPRGNLVVADTANHAIRRVTRDGQVTTLAGNGAPGDQDGVGRDARFNGPIGVAVAMDGRVIVADSYNDRLRQIDANGRVSTIAGRGAGYRDGTAADALFDTPSGVAIDRAGNIYVTDTGNDALRRLDADGQVTTIASALVRPVGIAVDEPFERTNGASDPDLRRPRDMPDPDSVHLYATDGAGRVLLLAGGTGGNPAVLSTGTPGVRFRDPSGVTIAPDGSLRLADSDNYLIRRITRPDRPPAIGDISLAPVPVLTPTTLRAPVFPWPLDPQRQWHEVAATLGEPRGGASGDGRERFHAGVDVQGSVGAVVRAVRDEKVQRPVGATGFPGLNESLRVGVVSYVHVRVGRTLGGRPLDAARFTVLPDESGRPSRVRVQRGTRFRVGDAIGTINAFAHVHLGIGPRGAEIDALSLPLPGFEDHVAPTIVADGVQLYGESGERLGMVADPRATRAGRNVTSRKARRPPPPREPIPVSGRVSIVVEAYDRVDGNRPTRRLGVYALGYQVLRADGTPLAGFEEPQATIEFDRLSADPEAPQIVYAEGSGITVYGNRTTRFRYIVTNGLREGVATRGTWDTSALPPGLYRLRVFAEDRAGNRTEREVRVLR